MKTILLLIIFLTPMIFGRAGIPDEPSAATQKNPSAACRLIRTGGQLHAVVQGRVLAIDPARGTWKPLVPDLPSMSRDRRVPGLAQVFWDGLEAYRVDPARAGQFRSGFHEMTRQGRQWYWRAPIVLEPADRVLAAFDGWALVRVDHHASTSLLKPGGVQGGAGPSRVTLSMVHATSGERREVLSRNLEPFHVQFAVAVHEGRAFLFSNTGEVHAFTFGQGSFSLVMEDFWARSGAQPYDLNGGPWGDPKAGRSFPRFQSPPFFDRDGAVLLAFEGAKKEMVPGEIILGKFTDLEPKEGDTERVRKYREERKAQLRRSGLFPFAPDRSYEVGVPAAFLLRFDPEKRTMQEEPVERLAGLTGPDPAAPVQKHPHFIKGGEHLYVNAEGRILWFDLGSLTEEIPAAGAATRQP